MQQIKRKLEGRFTNVGTGIDLEGGGDSSDDGGSDDGGKDSSEVVDSGDDGEQGRGEAEQAKRKVG